MEVLAIVGAVTLCVMVVFAVYYVLCLVTWVQESEIRLNTLEDRYFTLSDKLYRLEKESD